MIMDMALVYTGFARNFPNKAKVRSFDIHWNDGDFHNDLVAERIMKGTDMVLAARSEYSQRYVFDHYIIHETGLGEIIGIHCTVPQESQKARWEPCIAMVGRYIDTDSPGGPWSVPAQLFLAQKEDPCNYVFQNWFQWQHKIDYFMEYNFGPDVGSRWVVVIGTDMPYPGVVKEQFVWDMGPSKGTFNPAYGNLGYIHFHNTPFYSFSMEFYSRIIDHELVVNECNHIVLP